MNKTDNELMKELLIASKRIITKPEHWTKGANARTNTRKVVDLTDTKAVCYCIIGAISLAMINTNSIFNHFYTTNILSKFIPDKFISGPNTSILGLTRFNDHPKTKHKDVLSIFDQAIASL